jgi:hypothetical protein
MNQKRRDLILRRAERAIADENKCTLACPGLQNLKRIESKES